jgi:hypothetical protein
VVDDLRRNTMGKINKRTLRDAWLAGDLVTVTATPRNDNPERKA